MSFDTLRHPPGKAINPLTAFQRAVLSQLQPAMLALALLPIVAFAVLLGLVFWLGWDAWLRLFDKLLGLLPWAGDWFKPAPGQGSNWFSVLLAGSLGLGVYVLLVLVSALTLVSTLGMPLMLRHVAADYPQVQAMHGGSIKGSVVNTLWAVFWFLVLTLITLPLWLVPVVGWFVPIVMFGLLNARVLRYDALSEHASAEEMVALARAPRLWWRVLGFGGALLNVVPVLWFFSTTLTGLAFIHYALAALAAHRTTATQKAES